MKTLMRNGRDRRSENPFLGHARKERVSLFGTDQRITSGPAATRLHSKAEYMTAPERFADSQIPLAPRAPSIHDPRADGQTKRVSREVKPSTADRPNETARSESQETSPLQQRGPTSILIWGRPMGLDAEWQEIFAGRERRSGGPPVQPRGEIFPKVRPQSRSQ